MSSDQSLPPRLDEILPAWARADFYGSPVWVWITLPLLLIGVFLLARFVGLIATAIMRRGGRLTSRFNRLLEAVRAPAELALGVWLHRLGRSLLPLSGEAKTFLGYAEIAAGTLAGTWLLIRITGFGCDSLAGFFDRSNRSHAKAVIPLLRKVVQTAVVLFGFIFLLQNFDIDVGAMLAGLGIGGLALALAGKETVEDLFAGATLVIDQPARVGDLCSFGGSKGVIEDIGLRSTRIRTADRTVLTIPNSKLSEMQIENFASRDRILLKATLSLDYATTPDQMRMILEGVRKMLADREEIAKDSRVRFVAFTSSSLDLELFAYVNTRDYNNVFLSVREEIFLGIMDLVSKSGSNFASPSPPVIVQQATLPSEAVGSREA